MESHKVMLKAIIRRLPIKGVSLQTIGPAASAHEHKTYDGAKKNPLCLEKHLQRNLIQKAVRPDNPVPGIL